jgi:hypothetical protein
MLGFSQIAQSKLQAVVGKALKNTKNRPFRLARALHYHLTGQ